MDENINPRAEKEGAILALVLMVMIALSVLILSLFHLGYHSAREAAQELRVAQAFWLAEAGRQWSVASLYDAEDGTTSPRQLGADALKTFRVIEDPADASKLISIGVVSAGETAVTNAVRFSLAFVAPQFEKVIYGGNNRGGGEWTLQLRGEWDAAYGDRPNEDGYGGIDSLWGDVNINGNFQMFDDAKVGVPSVNSYGIEGDVFATGNVVHNDNISGTAYPNVPNEDDIPDLSSMNYAEDNNWDVAAEFDEHGSDSSGRLPFGHPLRNIVQKNPSGHSAEYGKTTGHDYYFLPGDGSLVLGDDVTYYVDGHVWFNDYTTKTFNIDGTAVIVSSRDIHVSDDLVYKDKEEGGDLLALVAEGQYDDNKVYSHAGNIYFGDPEFGTLYNCDAFMFAQNDFYYNTSANTGKQGIPESGFQVFGNFMALNQVVVVRDWYEGKSYKTGTTKEVERYTWRRRTYWREVVSGDSVQSWEVETEEDRAAQYDPINKKWFDIENPSIIYEENRIKHFAMRVEYDERIRLAGTRLSGLPRGNGNIFNGVRSWEEFSTQELDDLL